MGLSRLAYPKWEVPLDVGRLEERIAAETVRSEAKAERRRLRDEAARAKLRAKLVAAARSVSVGEGDDGRWIEFPADTDPSGNRAAWMVLVWSVVAVAVLPLFAWWSLWGLVPWIVVVGGTAFLTGLRYGREQTVRVVVTPRGYWALLDGGKVRHSGRVEDLRFHLGTYRKESASHGLRWVSVHGPDGKLCESEQLVTGSGATVKAFAVAVGAKA